MPARDSDVAEHGELCALYVDPEWWGRGVGAALILAARVRLVEQGFRDAVLWLLNGNTRADRFYRMDGWAPDGLSRTDTVWGVMVNEARWRRGLDTDAG
jgi:GNAT superfamily N-acetyltransferase